MSLPWQQRSPPLVVSPGRPKHMRYIWHTSRLICDFVKKIAQICQNFVAMATRVGPQHFTWFHWIDHPRKPPSRPKHFLSICHTSRLIGDFVQVKILGSKFWGLRSLNQKSKKKFCRVPHGELTAKMARFHRETKKKELFEGAAWQTYRQTESTTKNNRLLV